MDFSKIKTSHLKNRKSLVSLENFGQFPPKGITLAEWLDTLPRILGGQALREVAAAVRRARDLHKPVIVGLGGHVIKCGLGPILIGLMQEGFITAFACNGSVLVHDFELAFCGSTSEDVDESLPDGSFGVTEETGAAINQAAKAASARSEGLGQAMGAWMDSLPLEHPEISVLLQAWRRHVPFTAHVSLGCDVWHLHPSADGAAIGAANFKDFQLFCDHVAELDGGGVYVNLGSAVVLPEVFLKAVTAVRNLGHPLKDFTTANFDFIQHYRPLTNVVRRPVAGVGRGYALTGHHEILVPLLAALVREG